MATIIRYVDATRPDNSGDGLTPETAKRHIASIFSTLNRSGNEQIVRIRGGYCYDLDAAGTWGNSISCTNTLIEPYWLPGDELSNPLIDGVTYLAENSGGWTYEGTATRGGHVWSKQIGTAQKVRRVWTNTVNNGNRRSQRTFGDALRSAPNETWANLGITATSDNITSVRDNLSVTDNWWGSGSTLGFKLYMWTEFADQDPAKYWKGLGIAQSGAGTNGIGSAISMFNCQNVTINNLDSRAATATAFQIALTDTNPLCENIKFYRCKAYGSIRAFKIANTPTSAAYPVNIRKVEIRECYMDPMTSAREQEPNVAFSLLSEADQYDIRGPVEDIAVIDCVTINPTHGAMVLGSWDSAGGLPRKSGYLRHRVECADWCTYARGVNVSLCEPSCYIKNCTIRGTNVSAQLAGSIKVTGNKFYGLRKAVRKPSSPSQSTDSWISVNCYRGDLANTGVGNDRYFDTKPNMLLFANNSCDGCYGTPVEVLIYASATGATEKPQTSLVNNSFLFMNNVLIDTNPERAGKPYLSTDQTGGLSVGVQSFQNNVIYCGEGRTPTAKWQGTVYTDINSAPGHANNLIVNPLLDEDLKPLSGSPLAKAGIYCGVVQDCDGKRFGIKPAIGAHEITVTPVRPQRPT